MIPYLYSSSPTLLPLPSTLVQPFFPLSHLQHQYDTMTPSRASQRPKLGLTQDFNPFLEVLLSPKDICPTWLSKLLVVILLQYVAV